MHPSFYVRRVSRFVWFWKTNGPSARSGYALTKWGAKSAARRPVGVDA